MGKQEKPVKQPGQEKAPKLYEAKIEHTEDTIRTMYVTEHQTYHQSSIMARIGIGLAMILAAFMIDIPYVAKVLLLALGCWLLVSRDFSSINRAEDVIEKRHGSFPVMEYAFYHKDMVLSGEGKMHLKYDSIQRLIEDKDYLYLFQGKNSVCMLEKSSVQPNNLEEFMQFIAEKTGLAWRQNKSLLSMNLADVLQLLKDRRRR